MSSNDLSMISLIASKYIEKKPYADVCLSCKDNKLWYSKYQLNNICDFFSSILEQDPSVSKINLDFYSDTVASALYIFDTKNSDIKVKHCVELYKFCFYINFKLGMDIAEKMVCKMDTMDIKNYEYLKKYKFPTINIGSKLIDNILMKNKDDIITDVVKHCIYRERLIQRNCFIKILEEVELLYTTNVAKELVTIIKNQINMLENQFKNSK